MAHDVFISYSSGDKAIADAVCATMEAHRVRCWVAPRDVMPGANFAEAIVGVIKGSRVFVLIFSSRARESHHVEREVATAAGSGIPIIPFRIEDVGLTPAMDYYIGQIHWLDAITPPMEAHLQQLADNVRHLLKDAGGAAAGAVPPLPEGRKLEKPASRALPAAALALAALLVVIAVALALVYIVPGLQARDQGDHATTRFATPDEVIAYCNPATGVVYSVEFALELTPGSSPVNLDEVVVSYRTNRSYNASVWKGSRDIAQWISGDGDAVLEYGEKVLLAADIVEGERAGPGEEVSLRVSAPGVETLPIDRWMPQEVKGVVVL